MTTHRRETMYFSGEGRPYMQECLHACFEYCVKYNINKIVIFTGSGEGPLYALQSLLTRREYENLKVVAVTPPVGRQYRAEPQGDIVNAGVSDPLRRVLNNSGISVVSAHLPFKGIHLGSDRTSELARVGEAFGIMGGGFSLCIQSVLVACDAGYVDVGEPVVAASADTAIAAVATRTESFLSPNASLIVEHIVARPAVFTISKPHHQKWFTPPVIVPVEPPPTIPETAKAMSRKIKKPQRQG